MVNSYTINVSGVDKIVLQAAMSPAARRSAIRESLWVAGAHIEAGIKRRLTPNVRSGQTRSRITKRFAESPNSMSVIVGGKSIAPNEFNVLKGLEEGTGLFGPHNHVIVPKTKKALSWVPTKAVTGTATGPRVFARSVKGMKATRPISRTFTEDGPTSVRIFARTLAKKLQTT